MNTNCIAAALGAGKHTIVATDKSYEWWACIYCGLYLHGWQWRRRGKHGRIWQLSREMLDHDYARFYDRIGPSFFEPRHETCEELTSQATTTDPQGTP